MSETEQKPSPFTAWLRKHATTVPLPTIAAARKTLAATESAVAIAKQLMPDGKFTTSNVIEIARMIFDYEMSEVVEDDPGEEDPE